MARFTIIWADGFVSKDGDGYDAQDLSWLPNDILAVQVKADGSANLEKGDRDTLIVTSNEEIPDVSVLDWWANVEATWQAAVDVEAAAQAEAEAAFLAGGGA